MFMVKIYTVLEFVYLLAFHLKLLLKTLENLENRLLSKQNEKFLTPVNRYRVNKMLPIFVR